MRIRGRGRLSFLALGLALLLPESALARHETIAGTVETLDIEVAAPWPDSLRRGYQPVFVLVRNRANEPRSIEISMNGEAMTDMFFEVRDRFDLQPQSQVLRELVVPVTWNSQQSFSITDGISRYRESIDTGIADSDSSAAVIFFGFGAERPRRVTDPFLESVSNTERTLGFEQLPTRLASYTSLDAVWLDVTAGVPHNERIAALLAWVKSGGWLGVVGDDAATVRALAPALHPYLDSEALLRGPGASLYGCGLGRIVVAEMLAPDAAWNRAESSADRLPIHDAFRLWAERVAYDRDDHAPFGSSGKKNRFDSGTGRVPALVRTYPRFAPEVVPELKAPVDTIPSRGLLILLLFGFSMLIGPFSFYRARRSGTPLRALVLVPCFGLLGGLGMLSVAVFNRGLVVKSDTLAFAYLDQRTFRATVLEARAIHAPFADSFRLDGALAVCLGDFDPASFHAEYWNTVGRNERSYVPLAIDQSNGFEYSGGFAPPRRIARQLVIADIAARERLDLRYDGAGESSALVVTNALAVPVRKLVVRVAANEVWRLESPTSLAPGATARLVKIADAENLSSDYSSIPLAYGTLVRSTVTQPDVFPTWLSAQYAQLRVGDYFAITDGRAFKVEGDLDHHNAREQFALIGSFDPAILRGGR